MKKRVYMALVVAMIGLCGCTPTKDSERADAVNQSEVAEVEAEVIEEPGTSQGDDTAEAADSTDTTQEADDSNAAANEETTDEETTGEKSADEDITEENVSDENASDNEQNAEADADAGESSTEDTGDSRYATEAPSNPIADSLDLSGDVFDDYEPVLKDAVEQIVSSSENLQEELNGIEAIDYRFEGLRTAAETQAEMTQTSYWSYAVWDMEINSLWSRISETLKGAEKDNLLKEQRQWIAMKEEVILETLGRSEDGGSIYPMLVNELTRDMTRTRSYYLASVLAKAKGDEITLPKRGICGEYVDNQGTNEVYSSLIIKESFESGYEGIISIFRLGNVEGTVEKSGDDLVFTSYDEKTKGIIRYGWGGASLEITESNGGLLEKGEVYEFKFVF